MFELKRFVKNSYKMILGVSAGIAILYIIFQLVFASAFPNNSETEQVISPEYAPSSFKILIEEQDGTVFTNSTLIKEYFFLQRNLAELEEETQINLSELIENSIAEGAIQSPDELITFVRYANSSLFELVVSSSDEEKNLEIAEYYYDLFFQGSIPFLENKEIFEFTAPKLIEEEEVILEEITTTTSQIKTSIKNGVIGFILGVFLVTLALLVKALFSRKISYAFAYDWDQESLHQLSVPAQKNENEIIHFIAHPVVGTKLILHDQPLPVYLASYSSQTNFETANSITEVNPQNLYSEIIIFIDSGKTTRKWYQTQRQSLKNYRTQIKLIQHVD